MTATYEDVKGWEKEAKSIGATHIISVCDTFDYDDYPIFVMPHDNLQEKIKQADQANMQRINEVIEIK